MQAYKTYLYHYGVKGMKWGVRRTPEQLGHKGKVAKVSKRDIINNTKTERNISKQSSASINKGIRTLNKRVAEHKFKIKNPHKYCDHWDSFTEKRKQGTIKHWNHEIKNFQESINMRKEELRKRGDKIE